jgi:hypothetical protein
VPIIDSQKMYTIIQGKKHTRIEAWLTLGAILGILPREASITELPDGSYEARVDLLNRAGVIVGGASALCGVEEPRWSKAERYARRSMATTRATAKAYRLAFGWIAQLSGLEPTPAEEMPMTVTATVAAPRAAKPTAAAPAGFDPQNRAHQYALIAALKKKGIAEDKWDGVALAMTGSSFNQLDAVLETMEVFAK